MHMVMPREYLGLHSCCTSVQIVWYFPVSLLCNFIHLNLSGGIVVNISAIPESQIEADGASPTNQESQFGVVAIAAATAGKIIAGVSTIVMDFANKNYYSQ